MRDYVPFAAELARKDPSGGFTKENTIVVCQIVADLMGDDMGDEALHKFAERVACGTATDDDNARIAVSAAKRA